MHNTYWKQLGYAMLFDFETKKVDFKKEDFTDSLTGRGGEKIDCWVLNHDNDNKSSANGYERYWIAKKTKGVLKEEDYGRRGYRYKLKVGVSGI